MAALEKAHDGQDAGQAKWPFALLRTDFPALLQRLSWALPARGRAALATPGSLSSEKLVPNREGRSLAFPAAALAHSKPYTGHLAKPERGRSLGSKVFLQGLKCDISQTPYWPSGPRRQEMW